MGTGFQRFLGDNVDHALFMVSSSFSMFFRKLRGEHNCFPIYKSEAYGLGHLSQFLGSETIPRLDMPSSVFAKHGTWMEVE